MTAPPLLDPPFGDWELKKQWLLRTEANNNKLRIFRGTEAIAPAISLCSTARDMIEWIKFNLEGNGNLTDRAAAEEIQRGQVDAQRMFSGRIKPPLAPVSYQFPTYGLGWFVGSYRGRFCPRPAAEYLMWGDTTTQLPLTSAGTQHTTYSV